MNVVSLQYQNNNNNLKTNIMKTTLNYPLLVSLISLLIVVMSLLPAFGLNIQFFNGCIFFFGLLSISSFVVYKFTK